MSDANEVDPIGAALAAIDSQIVKLKTAREALEAVRGMTSTMPVAPATGRSVSAELDFAHDAFFGMTAGDAARKYLAARKKTASANAIGEALVEGGWKTASRNIGENIRAILSRNPDFVKINGEFGLAEWYPGRKSVPKPRPVNAQQTQSDETPEDIVRSPGGQAELD